MLSFKMVSPKVLGSWETGRVCGSVMQTPGGMFSQFLEDFEKFPKAQLDKGLVRQQQVLIKGCEKPKPLQV